ncbi:hypothetical protein PAXRUDRAFT_362594 [Paxillus rubicundulus Ve08.2h10]|uniref:Uncharacterized protein n=1 Tax=Paxillus rubicundulus Ve08.2h10 TaxID=930991 RepID=A0A0D0E3X6_9AGAM|nr:hypothetical protein PAXRUDRAFT_362594 [Paxillus rubicundulus Ve08.2h10]
MPKNLTAKKYARSLIGGSLCGTIMEIMLAIVLALTTRCQTKGRARLPAISVRADAPLDLPFLTMGGEGCLGHSPALSHSRVLKVSGRGGRVCLSALMATPETKPMASDVSGMSRWDTSAGRHITCGSGRFLPRLMLDVNWTSLNEGITLSFQRKSDW